MTRQSKVEQHKERKSTQQVTSSALEWLLSRAKKVPHSGNVFVTVYQNPIHLMKDLTSGGENDAD